MSKGRVSSDERIVNRSLVNFSGEVQRFIGISLSGGKADKACVAVVEYFPKFKKLFLSNMFERIKSEGNSELVAQLAAQGWEVLTTNKDSHVTSMRKAK